jgi:hypothetical protein
VALEDEIVFEPSPEVAQFYAELMERLPPPEAFTKEEPTLPAPASSSEERS